MELVARVPDQYVELLVGFDGSQQHPDLNWTAGGYVCHVTDNLRIWAERVIGVAVGGCRCVPGYDENLLAQARGYPMIPLAGALWSLQHAARDWQEALTLGSSGTSSCSTPGGASSALPTWRATTLTTRTITLGTSAGP